MDRGSSTVQETGIKTIPEKKICKKPKRHSKESLTKSCEKNTKAKEKRRDIPI